MDLPSTPELAPLEDEKPKRDWRFWMIFVSISMAMFLSALELTAVSTALPSIVNALHGSQFIWISSAYTLCATAFLPLAGGFAQVPSPHSTASGRVLTRSLQVFGRRPIMLGAILVFAAGSAVCGAAKSMGALIAGRGKCQGLGGGGIAALTHIILSDLVPLQERGMFNGLIAMVYTMASGIGPVVGGSLAERGNWRWIFYLNIPICGLAAALVLVFLNLRTPAGTIQEKLRRIDWVGNVLVIAATTSCVIALTWGGVQYAWNSAHILAPLILGLLGIAAFMAYEVFVPKEPIVPYTLMMTLTGLSGYLQTFVLPLSLMNVIYYLPVYFQACKDASPIASGVDVFGLAFSIAPFAMIGGLTIAKSGRYRPQIWFAWVLIMIGSGLLTTVNADTSRARVIGFEIVAGAGLGILMAATFFPVLAPLPVSTNALALALFTFFRNFAQVWGVTIGGTVLQNELKKRLPPAFLSVFPQGTAVAYSVIPVIPSLDEPLRSEVRAAFAGALRVLWQVLIGFGGLGLLVSLGMKGLPLHTSVDRNWGLNEDGSKRQSPESGSQEPKQV
ncbi:hypothetical protein EWM64_g2741 [Hericium alpestre]|uniref:Major facilitator superfamily (MFS) profile domain-containing protein n=1 Tax=Hericium alpestre TaxID=135208 RepID=A0A4Z0A2K9_9AGAM|nr:hypothetical protein EWM64_g2741 [Hericium alpestre]